MHCTLSLTVCMCTPCQRASFNSTTDSFSWGHACKARPSFDRCGTSLSVSLSLSLSLSGAGCGVSSLLSGTLWTGVMRAIGASGWSLAFSNCHGSLDVFHVWRDPVPTEWELRLG